MANENENMDLTEESTVDIFTCSDEVESALVQEALTEAGIRFLLKADMAGDPLGMIDGDHGEGIIAVLEEDADRAIEIIQAALPDETMIEEYEDDEDFDEDEEELEGEDEEDEEDGPA